jgi:ubiquinol-cytochrome c reductase cytochrome c1 subunit
MRKLVLALLATVVLSAPAVAAESKKPPGQSWSFDGIFGTFDRAMAQRGFQVYKENCTSCHSMNLLRYRNLGALGFSEDEVKAIAASVEVTDGPNDQGEMFQRTGRPSDKFKAPFANANAARAANNGAYPPDLSVITKARAGGADYIHAVLTGYEDPPAGVTLLEGMNYNEYFPGKQIGMPKPLNDDQISYTDGTKATVDQMARDVATFLTWAAEPEMEHRKALGVKVILFLLLLSILLYAVKRRVWADVH